MDCKHKSIVKTKPADCLDEPTMTEEVAHCFPVEHTPIKAGFDEDSMLSPTTKKKIHPNVMNMYLSATNNDEELEVESDPPQP